MSLSSNEAVSSDRRTLPNPSSSLSELGESVWSLPGLDKTHFYSYALYLHVAAKGQVRQVEPQRQIYYGGDRPEVKDFLNRLADCFARSKSKDSQAHVSAAAVVIQEGKRNVKLFIAKNLSGQDMDAHRPLEALTENSLTEDDEFAARLSTWFTLLSRGAESDQATLPQTQQREMWEFMNKYNTSRLEFYVSKVKNATELVSQDFEVWPLVVQAIRSCRAYGQTNGPKLYECAEAASLCLSDHSFFEFSRDHMERMIHDDELDTTSRSLARIAKWINYLARLGSAYSIFCEFCAGAVWPGYTYQVEILKSPVEEVWATNSYKKKIESWTGDLGLDDERNNRDTARETLERFAQKAGSRGTARVHCEMQLLAFLSGPQIEKGDQVGRYLGCSKKSCWLCWQLMKHFRVFSTSGTHQMIYPMWALPAMPSRPQSRFAHALNETYKDMMKLVQDKALFGKDFTSRVNVTHSSIRLHENPSMWPISQLNSSLSTPTTASSSTVPNISSTLTDAISVTSSMTSSIIGNEIWSSAKLKNRWKPPFASSRVVHLPAASTASPSEIPTPRLVTVDLFEIKAWSREPEIQPFRFKDKDVLFAFQKNTWARRSNEREKLEPLEARELLWCRSPNYHLEGSEMGYTIVYRLDEDNQPPNPWLVQVLREIHGANSQIGAMPFFGDVFLIAQSKHENRDERVTCLEPDRLDLKECLETIRYALRVDTEKVLEYAAIRHSGQEQLWDMQRKLLYRHIFDGPHRWAKDGIESALVLIFDPRSASTGLGNVLWIQGLEKLIAINRKSRAQPQ